MTEQAAADAATGNPEPIESGRYRVYPMPDGGLLIARATSLCDGCQSCGCGEQAEPIGPIPGGLVQMARAAAAGKVKIPAAMKAMMRGGH